MSTKAEELREALWGTYSGSTRAEITAKFAAAICDTLGITRELVARIALGGGTDECVARNWGDMGTDIGDSCQRAADALSAILDVAGR